MEENINNSAVKISLNLTSHKRYIKPQHYFSYSNISILINLQKIKEANSKSLFFSVNKFNIFSWYQNDHGIGEDNLLKWVKTTINQHDKFREGKVLLHCFPRIFGKVFNPLSVYFCYNKNDDLYAIIYEVRNTYGGYHSYVSILKKNNVQNTHKNFFVSPFLPANGRYFLNAKLNNFSVKISVNMYLNSKKKLLEAIQIGKIKHLSTKNLLLATLKGYVFPSKPFLSILIETLMLIIKGGKYKVNQFKEYHTTSKVSQRTDF